MVLMVLGSVGATKVARMILSQCWPFQCLGNPAPSSTRVLHLDMSFSPLELPSPFLALCMTLVQYIALAVISVFLWLYVTTTREAKRYPPGPKVQCKYFFLWPLHSTIDATLSLGYSDTG